MKPLLALVTLALTALIFEEKARQLAGDAQEATTKSSRRRARRKRP